MYLISSFLFITNNPSVLYSYTLMYINDILPSLFLFEVSFFSVLYSYTPRIYSCYYSNAGLVPTSTLCLVFTHIWSLRITSRELTSSLPNATQSHLSAKGPKGSMSSHPFLAQLLVSSLPWTPLLASFPLVLTPLALYPSP